jgi:hypothetical protein
MSGVTTSPNHYQRSISLLNNAQWDIICWLQNLETNLSESSAEARQSRQELFQSRFPKMNPEIQALVSEIQTLSSKEAKTCDLVQLAQKALRLQEKILESSEQQKGTAPAAPNSQSS